MQSFRSQTLAHCDSLGNNIRIHVHIRFQPILNPMKRDHHITESCHQLPACVLSNRTQGNAVCGTGSIDAFPTHAAAGRFILVIIIVCVSGLAHVAPVVVADLLSIVGATMITMIAGNAVSTVSVLFCTALERVGTASIAGQLSATHSAPDPTRPSIVVSMLGVVVVMGF